MSAMSDAAVPPGADAGLRACVESIRDAAREGRVLRIRGGGSKDFYGEAPRGEILDSRAIAGIVSYDPSELVITARAGTPLAELEAALAESGQYLPFEPPHFRGQGGAVATVGGMVAAGLSGPARASAGAVRDFVLGAVLVDGRGQVLHFGGQVMKNVAGYDVSRLLTGSLGTLGLIAEVSLKVMPRPPATATLSFALGQQQALDTLNRWGGQPLPLNASAWFDDTVAPEGCPVAGQGGGTLLLRLAGAQAAVAAAVAQLARQGGSRLDDAAAAALWQGLREHRMPAFAAPSPDCALWRLSLPQTAPAKGWCGASGAPVLVEWHGAQRWLWAGDEAAPHLRSQVQALGGHATRFAGGTVPGLSFFQPQSAVLVRIQQRLQQSFDPHGVFDRGRLGLTP